MTYKLREASIPAIFYSFLLHPSKLCGFRQALSFKRQA